MNLLALANGIETCSAAAAAIAARRRAERRRTMPLVAVAVVFGVLIGLAMVAVVAMARSRRYF